MATEQAVPQIVEQATTAGKEFREQWPLVSVVFLMKLFAFGFPTFALPFVYAGAVQEFGWTRQQAVLLASFKFYTSAAAALIVGRMLDTINPKYVVAISAALGALAMVGFIVADRLPVYYLLGIILGLNAAGMQISMNVIVSRAFERSPGMMLGIVYAGTSVAGIILPIWMVPLMGMVGWRTAMAIMSCGIWVVALPAWFLLFRFIGPVSKGLRVETHSMSRTRMWDHFKDLAETRDFWLMFVGAFLVAAVDQSLLQNQVLFLQTEKGLSLAMVAWGAALLAAVGIVAKIFFGGIFDRFSIPGIVVCYLVLAVSVGLSFTVVGVTTMLIFMTVRGIADGGMMLNGPVLLKHYYGTRNLGLNMGLFTLCVSIGFGFGPPFMASMADKSGTYSGAFALGTVAALVAAALLYPVKPRFWKRS